MSHKTPRERLYVDIPTKTMRMLDKMCEGAGHTRTSMVMVAIEESYLMRVTSKRIAKFEDTLARKNGTQVVVEPEPAPASEPEETFTHPDFPDRVFTALEVDLFDPDADDPLADLAEKMRGHSQG